MDNLPVYDQLPRWISTMKLMGANHGGLPQSSSLIGTGISHAFSRNTEKRMKNKKKNTRKSRVKYNIEKKDASLEPDGQNDMLI